MSKNHHRHHQGIHSEPIPDTADELLRKVEDTELTEGEVTLDDGRVLHVVFQPGRL